MLILKYVIPAVPPSNNKYIGRAAQWEYREVKKQWETLVRAVCKPLLEKPIEKATVTLCYFFPDRRRRDPDNYSGKMILDGLVKAGVLVDDSFGNIELKLKAEVDKDRPRVEIIILEKDKNHGTKSKA